MVLNKIEDSCEDEDGLEEDLRWSLRAFNMVLRQVQGGLENLKIVMFV